VKYKVQLKRSVVKTLKFLPRKEIKKIGKKIDSLEQNPIPKDSKKLKGEKDLYRVRVGDYRIWGMTINGTKKYYKGCFFLKVRKIGFKFSRLLR